LSFVKYYCHKLQLIGGGSAAIIDFHSPLIYYSFQSSYLFDKLVEQLSEFSILLWRLNCRCLSSAHVLIIEGEWNTFKPPPLCLS
jgi:hypothetical protein